MATFFDFFKKRGHGLRFFLKTWPRFSVTSLKIVASRSHVGTYYDTVAVVRVVRDSNIVYRHGGAVGRDDYDV